MPHQRDVQPYFEAIDLLVSPSHTEGLSNVILEALAFHRPVVATRVGGNAEILENEVSGLLVKSGDVRALADGILRVLTDKVLAARRLLADSAGSSTNLPLPHACGQRSASTRQLSPERAS